MKKIELLAPAGDMSRLKIALLYGADAVYIGGSLFSLRANAINFTIEEIKEAVIFAHNLNKAIYVTVNIIPHNKEVEKLEKYLCELDNIGVDAVIVSDPFIISRVQKLTSLDIHLSTQASAMNEEALEFYQSIGIKRAVLAREVTREDISKIIKNSNVEIECFIHGAMCSSISGRCVMSNFLTNRDANRGGCSQICRWDFTLYDELHNKLEGNKPFTFCAKDLIMIDNISSMIDMGITSLKIEGRMRSIYYIAVVVLSYRRAIDNYYNKQITDNSSTKKVLRDCAGRDLKCQFFDNTNDETCNYYNGRKEITNQDFLGLVLSYDKKTKVAVIEQRNYFKKGDTIIIFSPNHKDIEYTFNEIIDEDNNLIDIVRHPRQIVKVVIEDDLYPFDLLRKKV